MHTLRPRQLGGSPSLAAVVALLSATACARGWVAEATPDATHDDAALDARASDAAPVGDAGCGISAGLTPALDGVDDLAEYPASQRIDPGAMLGADGAGIVWDREHLYITVASTAFAAAYEPLHVYIQASTELGAPVAAQGKEYAALVPMLPFTPTHLVAVRRVDDSGTGGYDGVYVPAATWTTRTTAIAAIVSADQHTLSVVVPWSALGGCPTAMRIAAHVVHGVAGNEWKDLVPTTHAPWLATGGGYYEADLTSTAAIAAWTLR